MNKIILITQTREMSYSDLGFDITIDFGDEERHRLSYVSHRPFHISFFHKRKRKEDYIERIELSSWSYYNE